MMEKTSLKIFRSFYWPGIHRDANVLAKLKMIKKGTTYSNSCNECVKDYLHLGLIKGALLE